jgi:large subunit ribosomal protein L25
MAEITVEAETGRPIGTAASGRLRAEGRIPAVIYGHGLAPLPVSVDGRSLRTALSGEAGLNALLSVRVDGQTHLTMAKDIQRHPVRNTVLHLDLQVVRRDEVVTAEVPINLVGDPLQVTRNQGVVEHTLTSLTIHSEPGRIPTSIDVDVSELTIGETIRVGDLQLPSGVTTDLDPEEAVVIAQGSAVSAEVAAEEAEAAEAAEEAAGEG